MERLAVRIYKSTLFLTVDLQDLGIKYNCKLTPLVEYNVNDAIKHIYDIALTQAVDGGHIDLATALVADMRHVDTHEAQPGLVIIDEDFTLCAVAFDASSDERRPRLVNEIIPLQRFPNRKNDISHFGTSNMDGLFEGMYTEWRTKRINKLIQILGKDWFKGKNIFELAAGHGHVSAALHNLGANVSCSDGRREHIAYIKQRYPFLTVQLIDQDTNWVLDKEYDLIINWGVSYHLDNWQQDLAASIRHGKLVSFETNVNDSLTDYLELKVPEEGYDQALNKVGTRPSAGYIERVVKENNATFTRYDAEDINYLFFTYDWVPTGEEFYFHGARRFWLIQK